MEAFKNRLNNIVSGLRRNLANLVPAAVSDAFNYPPLLFCITCLPDGFEVREIINGLRGPRQRGQAQFMSAWPEVEALLRARKRRWGRLANARILVPEESCFSLERNLPVNAAAQAGSMLQLEMQRVAPFSSDQVLYGFTLNDRGSSRAQQGLTGINARLYAVKKGVIEPVITSTEQTGMAIHSIGVRIADLRGRFISLDESAGNRKRAGVFGAGLNKALMTTTLLFLIAGVVFVGADSWRRLSTLDELESKLDLERQKAMRHSRSVNLMRDQLQKAAELRVAKNAKPTVLETWNEFSKVIPLDSWLREFSIRDNRATLTGSSKSASKLIRALEDSPVFTKVEFGSSTALDPATRLERFEINLMLGEAEPNGSPE